MTNEIYKPEKDVKKLIEDKKEVKRPADEGLGSGVAPSPIDANKGRK
jgi:hypothetical protein